jgi:CRP/FNR family transcriptional regulator
MNDNRIKEKLNHLFEDALIEEIAVRGREHTFNAGEEILDIGQSIRNFPLVIKGSLKVMTENEQGQELLLYYLEMGDTCAMTLQCCLNDSKSEIRVVAEDTTDVILVPVRQMEEWIVKYPSWRRFIFNSYHERLSEMLDAIDSLAFQNLEDRLYKYLRDKAMVNGSAEVKTTHREIATELNTARVVISRLIKKLEQQAKIVSDRNCIRVNEFA